MYINYQYEAKKLHESLISYNQKRNNVETIKNFLKEYDNKYHKSGISILYVPELNNLLEYVGYKMAVNIRSIQGNSRVRELVFARHIFCYLARSYTDMYAKAKYKWQEIGFAIHRDHSTAVYSYNAAKKLIEINDSIFKPYWKLFHDFFNPKKKSIGITKIRQLNYKINKYMPC